MNTGMIIRLAAGVSGVAMGATAATLPYVVIDTGQERCYDLERAGAPVVSPSAWIEMETAKSPGRSLTARPTTFRCSTKTATAFSSSPRPHRSHHGWADPTALPVPRVIDRGGDRQSDEGEWIAASTHGEVEGTGATLGRAPSRHPFAALPFPVETARNTGTKCVPSPGPSLRA